MARNRTAYAGQARAIQLLELSIVRITLVVLILIPLVFPIRQTGHPFGELKTVVLHVGMLVVSVLWMWQLGLKMSRDRKLGVSPEEFRPLSWVGRNPARWAIVLLVVMWVAQAISTAFSPLPVISVFGSDEQFPGNNLYDSYSFLVIFLVVAFKFRSRKRLEYLVLALIGSATIAAAYGVAQHFGWDPLGYRAGGRVLSSFGNTINFSAYLLMAIPATIAISLKDSSPDRKFLLVLAGALALQIAGMWFSESRGPYVGVAFAVLILFIGIGLLRSRAELIRSVLIVVAALVISAVIVFLPSQSDSRGFASALSIGGEISNLGTGATSTDGGGGMSGRIQNWSNTLNLARGWDLPEDEPTLKRSIRPLFGLGPAMFAYSYPLVGDPHPDRHFTAHPHNYALLILVGQGFVGLILLVSSTLLIVVAGWRALRKIRSMTPRSAGVDWILIAFGSAFIGKIVESQTGVARISDLAMMFALAGGVLAVAEITAGVEQEQTEHDRAQRQGWAISRKAAFSVVIVGITVSTVLASVLVVGWDMRRLSASLDLTFGERAADGSLELSGLKNAQSGAPERRNFTMQLANLYFIGAQSAAKDDRLDDARDFAVAARELLVEYEKRDPYERNTQLALAKTSSTLVEWGFDDFIGEMRDRYLRIATLFQTYPSLVATSATAMARVGENELAIELAERVIATEDTTKPWAVAWYAKGAALINLDSYDQAIEAFDTAIEKEPKSAAARLSHSALAFIYRQRGQAELAEIHETAALQ